PNAYSFTTAAKTAVTNTGGSATVVYNGSAIDLSTLSGLFSVDTNAGARTYTIETGGSATGAGTIGSDGKLTVTSAGTFTIGLATAETGTHAAGAKVTATLTVNKANIIVTGVAATKEYDGSPDFSAAQIDIRGAMLTGNFDGTNLMLLKTGVRGSLTSANAGTSGYLSLTDAFALGGSAAGNYTMVMQPAVSASITKATSGLAANPSPLKAYVTLGTSGNASVDLGAIALLAAHSYGTSSYALGTFDAGDGVVTAAPALSGTTLTYSYNTTSSALGSTSTQAVTITTTNYADISVNVVFEVTNKASVTIGGVSFAAKTYDGTPVVPTGTATVTPAWSTLPLLWHYAGAATDGTTYSESGTDVSLPAAPTKAGSYSLRISTDPADAVTGETTINFTINKATLTFKADDKTITAGASVPTYTYTLSGLASGDTAAEVVRTAPTPVCVGDMNTAGTYDITVSGAVLTSGADAKGANYEVAYASGTLTVNAAPPAGGGGDDGGSDGGDGSGSGSGDGSGGTTTPPTTVIITPPASTNTPNVTTAPTTSPDPVTSEGSAQTNTGGSSTLPASETPLAAAAETGGFPWLILVIGGLAVVIVATGVILLGKRKKV
ncbi:MAG: hypothetical protein LBU31_01235, partial [Coriobacteriales bacterium]|nr:hypothetical protein [Coriobacteriales bacterium]